MKPFYYLSLFCFFSLGLSCSSDDGTPPDPDADIVANNSLLVGTYEGVSFIATVPSGIVETKLSGQIIFEKEGNYNSTISPFSLNENKGTWTYRAEEQQIIFNEDQLTEEVAENVILTSDSLFFRIRRGEVNNLTVIDFKMVKQE